MVISGVLCGIAGLLIVAGTDHIINDGSAKGYGYTAIIVSWLAKFNPFYMVLTAFLVIFLKQGASELSTRTSGVITDDFANILIAIIILFIIGCEFFINYRIKFRARQHREKEAAEQ
jgi:simple sugar transport system permease protein